MKSIAAVILCLAAGALAGLPNRMVTRAVGNCAVTGTATAILQSGTLTPEVITIPGSAVLEASIRFTQPLPTDLGLTLNITKLEPFPSHVPCLEGQIGSCKYDACDLIANNATLICPLFPPELKCECPLAAGTFDLNPIPLNVPDLGDLIGGLMVGNYEGVATLYSKSNEASTIGCLQFSFRLEKP